MKRQKIFFLFSTILIFLLGNPELVLGCSCVPTAPCQSFGNADVAFVGKVIGSKYQRTENEYETINEGRENEKTIEKKVTYDIGEIYFEVTETFNGAVKGSRLTINSSTGGGDCGYWFKRGETYVVFAGREDSKASANISSRTFGGSVGEKIQPDKNRLWTTICSGTRELKDATNALSYLRNLPKAGAGGTIVGRIDENIHNYAAENLSSKPLTELKLKAQRSDDENQFFFGRTDQNGYYEIKVPVGNYLVTPVLEPNLTFSARYGDKNESVKIEDRRCASKIFWVSNDSEISGRLVDAKGVKVSGVSLDLIPAGKDRRDREFKSIFEYVGEDGLFSFKGVPVGHYQISLNFNDKPDDDAPFPTTFYPSVSLRSRAQTFEIDYGTKIKDLVFQLPPQLVKRKISGTIVWKNGKPAVGAEIQLVDTEADRQVNFNKPKIDTRGNFMLEGFEGRQYKIKATVWKESPDGQSGVGIADAESKIFSLDAKTPNFRIVLEALDPAEKEVYRKTIRAH